jgi:hypothetical protein
VVHIYRLWCDASKIPCDIRHVPAD